jgi:hypothetical protein
VWPWARGLDLRATQPLQPRVRPLVPELLGHRAAPSCSRASVADRADVVAGRQAICVCASRVCAPSCPRNDCKRLLPIITPVLQTNKIGQSVLLASTRVWPLVPELRGTRAASSCNRAQVAGRDAKGVRVLGLSRFKFQNPKTLKPIRAQVAGRDAKPHAGPGLLIPPELEGKYKVDQIRWGLSVGGGGKGTSLSVCTLG